MPLFFLFSLPRGFTSSLLLRGQLLAALAALLPQPTLPLPSLAGTIASVWQMPTNLPSTQPCDVRLDPDLGCNSFWLREDGWGEYLQQRATMWPLVRASLGGGQPGATVLLYFPLFLADPVHGGVALRRLDKALSDARAAGLRTALFIGRPDYHTNGSAGQTWNPVLDPAARAYVLAQLALLVTPARAAGLSSLSLYWMGLACHDLGEGACSEDAVRAYTAATASALRSAAAPASPPPLILNHVDGMFWDACWPQPCAAWRYGGYSPASLNGTADGLLGESWAMGSLVGAVNKLYALGVATNATTLLLDDTPNCDLYPTAKPCSTGNLQGDVAAWGAMLPRMGLEGTWGVWAAVDGGAGASALGNYYGDLLANGTGLTAKGWLHRARALAGGSGGSGGSSSNSSGGNSSGSSNSS